jgi:hypothetical protein
LINNDSFMKLVVCKNYDHITIVILFNLVSYCLIFVILSILKIRIISTEYSCLANDDFFTDFIHNNIVLIYVIFASVSCFNAIWKRCFFVTRANHMLSELYNRFQFSRFIIHFEVSLSVSQSIVQRILAHHISWSFFTSVRKCVQTMIVFLLISILFRLHFTKFWYSFFVLIFRCCFDFL